jgi:hypothetical protein
LRKRAAKATDHLIGGQGPLGAGLQGYEDEAGIGLPAAGESDCGSDRRIVLHDRNELHELLLHELERDALVGLNTSNQPAGILLREEALRNDDEQIKVETEGDEQDGEDRARVIQRPSERALVAAQHGPEQPLAGLVQPSMPGSSLAPQ